MAQSDIQPIKQPANKSRRWLRRVAIAAGAAAILLVGVELFCRFYLGLGDPPLSMKDPDMAYVFKPARTYHRFGHLIHYNAWSMRSDDFPEHKSDASELRVMVFGDSVINGGVLTDQSQVGTTLLQRRLAEDLHRTVVVGNISAGGWGPGNELGYARRLGLFDADVVVIVVSSHDYSDSPKYDPITPTSVDAPENTPWCATWEAMTRYLPRYLPHRSETPYALRVPAQEDIDRCLSSARQLVDLARARHAKVIAALHLTPAELDGKLLPGHDALKGVFDAAGVPVVELGETFGAAIKAGKRPYRDEIHPNELGQELLAEALRGPIEKAAGEGGMGAPVRH